MSRIHTDPDFEPRIADWLESDPDLAPREVLATVLAAFPSIPQRRASRVPRRFQPMNRFALLGAAAAIVVAAGLGGLVLANRNDVQTIGASPSPSPSASPSPGPSPTAASVTGPQLTETFSSPLYHYTVAYDPSWVITPSTLLADANPDAGDAADDLIAATGTDTTVMVFATKLDGLSWQAYLDVVEQDLKNDLAIPVGCRTSQPWPAITVGGHEGVRIVKCNQQVIVVHVDDQAYHFIYANRTFDTGLHLDGPSFAKVLDSVTFLPMPTASPSS